MPRAIEALRDAQTREQALEAYTTIDAVASVQESLYEIAEPAIACLLAILPDCNHVARPMTLGLLYSFGSGDSHMAEIEAGNLSLEERCHAAVKLGTSYYFYYLEHGTAEEKKFCAPLLELCARKDSALAARARWWFEYLLKETSDPELRHVYDGTLQDIVEGASDSE